MSEFLYRFRPLSRLISGGELENQEIYFAHPKQLNDPMEGFRDIFWRGDIIVWRNFFRHYMICLDCAYTQLVVVGEGQPINWEYIPIFNHGDINDGTPRKEAESAIVSMFFDEPSVRQLIELLASRNFPVRRNEIAIYLRSVHFFALMVIRQINYERGLENLPPNAAEQISKAKNGIKLAIGILSEILKLDSSENVYDDKEERLFSYINRRSSELEIINIHNSRNKESENKNFVFHRFPTEYPQEIECLIYPDWYVACFMSNCQDSSIWGTYGDGHKAVCLRFRTQETNGIACLDLERECGYGSSGPIVKFVPHQFHQVIYENKHEEVDFFRSLGRFPAEILRKNWHSDESGDLSPCWDEIFSSEESWRENYWRLFQSDIVRKLDHWRSECEYRLILEGGFIDFTDPKKRVTHYRFASLEGVIFGINTPMSAKLKIFEIIEAKCRKEGRSDFRFYQAYYRSSTGAIDYEEMSSLRFGE